MPAREPATTITTMSMNSSSNSNRIPQSQSALLALGVKARTGAAAHAGDVPLVHNSHVEIGADLHALIGDPATPEQSGLLGAYSAAKEALVAASDAAKVANKAGMEFCRQAIALLKPHLGNVYNSAWETAGFMGRYLAAPRRPVPMLVQLRQYFERHPAHANASLQLTAAAATAHLNAIAAADLARSAAEGRRLEIKAERDRAVAKLYKRLSHLREELSLLLTKDDARWRDFGFHRPDDRRIPASVEEVAVTPIAPGVAIVEWNPPTLATNCRVSWRTNESGAEWNEVGLFTDPSCTITNLPTDTPIIIGISARNPSGETARTEIEFAANATRSVADASAGRARPVL
jgi:hypothetical protein